MRIVGSLGDPQIARLAHESYVNSVSLLHNVRLLLPGSQARSLSLTILAVEEPGKIPALFDMRTEDPPERWEKFS